VRMRMMAFIRDSPISPCRGIKATDVPEQFNFGNV
jgi:hypothetical protein